MLLFKPDLTATNIIKSIMILSPIHSSRAQYRFFII